MWGMGWLRVGTLVKGNVKEEEIWGQCKEPCGPKNLKIENIMG